MRKKLIDAIIHLSGDEIETLTDVYKLSIASEEELIDTLINIAKFLKHD